MPAGQPTKYNEEMLQKTQEYIAGGYKTLGHQIPTVTKLHVHLDVSRQTVYQWAEDHPEYSDTLRQLKHFQKDALLEGGLAGDMNPTITKLVLASNHQMYDREEREHSFDLSNLSEAELKARFSELSGEAE